jgi:YidC/Oxa1 family membrane protein insertase
MEKRVLLAVTLSFLVLAAYQYFFVKPPQRPAARPPAAASGSPPPPAPFEEISPAAPAAAAVPTAGEVPAPAAPAVASLVADTAERDVVVDSEAVRAVFSTRGAELRHWQLKHYLDDRGRPVDLVPEGLPAQELKMFVLSTEDAETTQRLATALFRPSATALTPAEGQRRLSFEYQAADGLVASKSFEFQPDGLPYVVRFSAQVTRNGQLVAVRVASGPGLGDTDRAASGGGFFSPSYYQKPQAIFQVDRSVTRLATTELVKSPSQQGRFRYIGSDDHYFLSALLPAERNARVDYRVVSVPAEQGPRDLVSYSMSLDQPWKDVAFFIGPKHFDQLRAVDVELVRTIHFGMFDWLVVPLLRSLNWVNGFVGNYGWSIILLTAIINLLMWPLRHRSMVSMRKMQALQPQVKAIQDRYANLKMTDPSRQKMNTELMNLYREKGVNPASGCVPMLLTFPVLFAFYAMLSQAIELRGAPFVGWITDLSVRDPYFITPLLMGASMVWQQRMTPSTADPVQQKVFMFMPVMFTVMFLWAPSGLVIYWFVSNLFAIGQQYLTNRTIGALAPARS